MYIILVPRVLFNKDVYSHLEHGLKAITLSKVNLLNVIGFSYFLEEVDMIVVSYRRFISIRQF